MTQPSKTTPGTRGHRGFLFVNGERLGEGRLRLVCRAFLQGEQTSEDGHVRLLLQTQCQTLGFGEKAGLGNGFVFR